MAISEARRDPARRARFCEILRVADLDGLLDVADKDPKLTIMETVGARKHVSAATLRSVQTGLATELGVRLEDFARMDGFMDWSEVQTMSERGIAFGGHGAEHRLLTQISPEEAQHEVSASKAVLESLHEEDRADVQLSERVLEHGDCQDGQSQRLQPGIHHSARSRELPRRPVFDSAGQYPRRYDRHDTLFLARLVGLF